jgi:hypothetical protein
VTKEGKGWKGGVKNKQINKEEETKAKIKEEVEEDSDLLEVNKIVSGKQKYIYSSKYLKDQYRVNYWINWNIRQCFIAQYT